MNRKIANTVYVLQNIAVPLLVYFFVVRDLPALAYITVLLSKWRIFAVGWHFWIANIRSNAADIMVGLSTVSLMSLAPSSSRFIITIVLALLYAGWLLLLKPRSGTAAVAAQALIAQFYALTSLYLVIDSSWESMTWLAVIIAWVVGRLTARHFLSIHSELEDRMIVIALWGFVMAQLGWVFWIWNVIYTLPSGMFSIPLIALLATIFGYAAGSIYHAKQSGSLTNKFVLQQAIFVSAILLLVVIFTPWTGQV